MATNEQQIASKVGLFKDGNYVGLVLSEKQKEAMAVLCDNETKEILFGGAASGGKSYLGCEWLLWSCLAYPGTKWFIGRHHLTEVRKSTIETMFKVFKKHNIPASYYKYNDSRVRIVFENKSVIEGIELMYKPSDKEFEGFGSTEYTGGWIEEGGGIHYKAFEIANMRINRHLNDEYKIKGKLLITGNPSRNWQYTEFYKPAMDGRLKKGRVFMQSFVSDNTFGEKDYEERLQSLTGASRARLYLGDWEFIDDPTALCDPEAIQDIYTNDFIKPDIMDKRLVIDVAMRGVDLLRAGVFYGKVLVDHDKMEKSGGKEVLAFAKRLQAKHGIRESNILYDADGVGAFLGGEGGFLKNAVPFHGGAQPFKIKAKDNDPDKSQKEFTEYRNLKAQCGYTLASNINEGLIWAKAVTEQEDQETLTEELGFIKADKIDSDGKLTLLKKELIIDGLGRSPDFSDLFLMNEYFDLKEKYGKKKFIRKTR